MKAYWDCLCVLLFVHLSSGQPQSNLPTVNDRIYKSIQVSSPCFRLTNATHQIGCSASLSNTYGVVDYVDSNCDFSWLLSTGPTPPYIALLEPECFTNDNIMLLQSSQRVGGILLRIENTTLETKDPSIDNFSPERSCPSEGFGENAGEKCSKPWNPFANNLLFHDFGDFPILAVFTDQFESVVECYNRHNANVTTGSFADYPLCNVELTADMFVAKDTPTCMRRESLPINYLSGVTLCQPLGDNNVWGSFSRLPADLTNQIVMLSTKMDSVSLFPGNYSFGANSEVAGIVVLLAVIEQLGTLRRNGELNGTDSPILYSFFNGESWDYIGSSRMVYDMEKNVFPNPLDKNKLQLPLLHVANISKYIELSQLGLPRPDGATSTLFLHGVTKSTDLTTNLRGRLSQSNVTLTDSTRASELPPASLQRFIRAGAKDNPDFEGYVLTAFDDQYNNRFFGSRYDDQSNLINNSSLDLVVENLSGIATALSRTVLTASGPICSSSNADCTNSTSSNSSLIKELLTCFLVNSNCTLFRSVTNQPYRRLLRERPLNRYVTVSADSNVATSVIFQLAALYNSHNNTILPCSKCTGMVNSTDQVTNITLLPFNETHCQCLETYTYMHRAESPAFDRQEYSSTEYSTWAESRWNAVAIRMYLVAHSAEEAGVLVGGIALTIITLLLAIQCSRMSVNLFQPPAHHDQYHVS